MNLKNRYIITYFFSSFYDRFEDELDHQHNCYVSYKLYLKCNGYEEKGYFDWGD